MRTSVESAHHPKRIPGRIQMPAAPTAAAVTSQRATVLRVLDRKTLVHAGLQGPAMSQRMIDPEALREPAMHQRGIRTQYRRKVRKEAEMQQQAAQQLFFLKSRIWSIRVPSANSATIRIVIDLTVPLLHTPMVDQRIAHWMQVWPAMKNRNASLARRSASEV
mmetsp:Transcript_83771/g.240824  ORF Transcript_83771/g.240824 Transcript_83771/m.240824 type:complete len:163 (-) Transcript_83771:248-736(-)